MSLQTGKEFRRIALLIVIAGMIMGLASPSACDEFYDNLLKLNGYAFELRPVKASPVPDCITSSEASGYNPYRPIVRRSGNSRTDLFRLTSIGSLCFSDEIHFDHLLLLLLIAAILTEGLSYYHILFIHLKDGHK